MSSFGETLNECLELTNITQTSLAEEIGCTRTMIYSILKNERTLSEEKFQKLVANAPFSNKQIDKLRKAYYQDKYPDGVIDKIFFIKEWFANSNAKRYHENIGDGVLPEQSVAVTGENQMIDIIIAIMSDINCKNIITNYPYSEIKIDDVIYSFLKEKGENINFKHILKFEDSNKSTNNLNNIFSTIRFLKIKKVPLHYFSSENVSDTSSIYPYFFLSDNNMMLFNISSKTGVFINDIETIKNTAEIIEKIVEKCIPLGNNYDILGIKDANDKFSQRKCYYIFGNFPCLGTIVTEDIIRAVARRDLPNREMLIKIAINHYNKGSRVYPTLFFKTGSLKKFVHSGFVQEIPKSWEQPLSFAHRKEIIQKLKQMAESEPQKLFLVDDDSINNDDIYCNFEVYKNSVFLGGSVSVNGDEFSGEYAFFIRNQGLVADFKYYINFILRNNICQSKTYTSIYFDDLILECDRLQNEENK